jgi:hypothetical protein
MAMGMCLHLLWRLPGENDRDIDKFVSSLPQAQQQALWKKFEYNRHACLTKQESDDFSKLATGPGSQQRKRNLLNAWLIAGKDASAKAFQDQSFFQASIFFSSSLFQDHLRSLGV